MILLSCSFDRLKIMKERKCFTGLRKVDTYMFYDNIHDFIIIKKKMKSIYLSHDFRKNHHSIKFNGKKYTFLHNKLIINDNKNNSQTIELQK
jgi:hypothetical protein